MPADEQMTAAQAATLKRLAQDLNEEHLRRILAKFSTYYNGWRPHVSLGKGCTKQTPDRALRGHCRTCNLGRIASPVRTNLVFGSDNGIGFSGHDLGNDVAINGGVLIEEF